MLVAQPMPGGAPLPEFTPDSPNYRELEGRVDAIDDPDAFLIEVHRSCNPVNRFLVLDKCAKIFASADKGTLLTRAVALAVDRHYGISADCLDAADAAALQELLEEAHPDLYRDLTN